MAPPPLASGGIERLAVAAWHSGADRCIGGLNAPAAALLGADAEACVGRPCHEVIAALEPSGERFCGPCCSPRRELASGEPCRSFDVRIRARPVWLLCLPPAPSEPDSVVHLALDRSQDARLQDYLAHVAQPDGFRSRAEWAARFQALTSRQREILRLLGACQSPAAIALGLHRSLLTVRNHIQHLLATLGVHSVAQAVALHLLYGEGAPGAAGAPPDTAPGSPPSG